MNTNFNQVLFDALKRVDTDKEREIAWKLSHASQGMRPFDLQFEGYEVHPIIAVDKEAYETAMNIHDPAICAWGLYGHLIDGGITWISDFSSEKAANTAMQYLEESAGILNTSTAPEVDEETVTLIVASYDWECPHCSTWNTIQDNPETVTCGECGRTYAVDAAVHIGK